MKKIYLRFLLLITPLICSESSLYAQAVVCPSLAANSVTLNCSTPCATLNVTPSVNLQATTSYSVSAVTYAPFSYTTGTTATFAGAGWSSGTDDSYGDIVNLPFNFCFFGTSYNKIVIGTNGNICFNAVALANAYDPYSISGPLPGSNCTATENAIMGVWNDTYVGGGNIKYATYGTAPCRQFVISWNAVDLFLPGTYCDGNTTTSQIVLYESSNFIDINIGRRAPCAAWNSGYSVCGIENNAGSVFYCPPGENGTTYSATNLSWRFTPTGATSGWTYNWVAPGGASAGTGATVVVCPTVNTVYTVTGTSVACTGVTVSTTASVTVTSAASPITGTPSMCIGATTSLSDPTAGGTWSSTPASVATVSPTGVVSGLSGGTATISYALPSGCIATMVVTVSPIPVISGPTNVCSGSSITLTSSVPGLTWSVSNTAIATIGATTGVLTGITPGVETIYCPPLGTGCTATYTVTINPVANITGTASLCMGTTTTLTSSVVGGTWLSGSTGVATVSASGVVDGISAGTATISYTTPGGCLTKRIVTVNPVALITGVTALCAGGTTTLSNAVTGGTWLSGNTAIATITPTTGVVSGIAPGTSIITYTTAFGCTSTTTVTVIILSGITGNQVLCQGSTTTLFDGGGGGVWSSGNPGVATIGAASGVVAGISAGTANITYTAGGSGCYTTTTVTVNALPAIPVVTNNSPICADSTLMLFATDATTGINYKWTGPASFLSILQNLTIPNAQSGNGGIYNLLITNTTTGCTSTGSTTVVIKPTPAPPSLSALPIPCNGGTLTLSANGAAGATYSWSGPAAYSSTSQNNNIPAVLGTSNGTYTVIATLNGCPSLPATVVATITPNPAAPIVHDTSYCQFYTGIVPLNYQVDSAIGSRLNWFLGTTPLPGAPLPDSAINTYPAGTTWLVTQTVNGCTGTPASVRVTIIPKPQFSINYRNWVCQHDSIMLSYTIVPGSALVTPMYIWSLPVGATAVNGTNVTQPSVDVKFDSANVTYYDGSLTISNLGGECSTNEPFSVRVIPSPVAYAYSRSNICQGDTTGLGLTSKSADAVNFYWYIDGNTLSSSTVVNLIAANSNSGGPYSISWNDSGNHIITIECSTAEGCLSLPTHDTVEVHAIPDATFTYDTKSKGTLCLEDSVLFIANNTNYNCAYLWLPEHSFKNDNKPQIWGKVEQSQSEIMLTVTDPFGCVGSSVQEIDPNSCCTVLFPNAFTPNGDTHNDFFRPIFSGYHKFHSFMIVNRWGQTVFESDDTYPQWDGNHNGVPQDIGVYYYYIKYDCGGKTIEQKGDCTLVR